MQCQVQEKQSFNIRKSLVNGRGSKHSSSEFLFYEGQNLQSSSDKRKNLYLFANNYQSHKGRSFALEHQRNQRHIGTDQSRSCRQFKYRTSSFSASEEKEEFVQQKDNEIRDEEACSSSVFNQNRSNSETTQEKLHSIRLEQFKRIKRRREELRKKQQSIQRVKHTDTPTQSLLSHTQEEQGRNVRINSLLDVSGLKHLSQHSRQLNFVEKSGGNAAVSAKQRSYALTSNRQGNIATSYKGAGFHFKNHNNDLLRKTQDQLTENGDVKAKPNYSVQSENDHATHKIETLSKHPLRNSTIKRFKNIKSKKN